MKVYSGILNVLVLLCLASMSVTAQDSDKKKKRNPENKYPQSGPVFVKGNLMVLDASGNPVDDLDINRLRILEDGVEQKVTHFVRKMPPVTAGLVFDNSGSIRAHIDSFIQAGKIFLTNLSGGDGSFVVRFVSSDKVEVLQDYTTDREKLHEAIDNLYIEGGQSAVVDGLYLAAGKVAEWEKKYPKNRFAVVLLTDGEDRQSYYSLDQLLKAVEGSDMQIFPVFFTRDLTDKYSPTTKEKYGLSNATRLANILALKTGGRAVFVDKKLDNSALLEALRPVIIEMRSQYVFGYTSTNQKRDGSPRKLTIEVTNPPAGSNYKTIFRESFVVPLD